MTDIFFPPATGNVAVMRWVDPAAVDGFIGRFLASLKT